MIEELERLTREAYPDEPDASHLDYVVGWQSSGQLLSALHKLLDISPDMLERYLTETYGDEAQHRLREARRTAAYPLQEQSLQVALDAKPDNVQVARLQSDALRRTAEMWSTDFGRATVGKTPESIGQLHLAALMGANAALLAVRNDASARVSLELGPGSE